MTNIYEKLGTFNHETLLLELRAPYPEHGNAIGWVTIDGGLKIIVPDGITEAEIDGILAAHNPLILTTEQQTEQDALLTKSQIKDYLREQLLSANPNPATIKTTIQAAVGSNVNISQAIDNMAIMKTYDTNTNLGYIAACIDVVAIIL